MMNIWIVSMMQRLWHYSLSRIKKNNLILHCCPLFWGCVIITYQYSAESPHCCQDRYHCRWGEKKPNIWGRIGFTLIIIERLSSSLTWGQAAAVWTHQTWSQTSLLGIHPQSWSSVGLIWNTCPCDGKHNKFIQTRESFTCQMIEEHGFSVQWNTGACHLLYPICWQLALPCCSVQPREQTVLQFLPWVE